jgi:thiamine-phosphate pyrophosphorylase
MTNCRLFLFTPKLTLAEVAAFAPRFAAASEAGQAASALLRLAPGADSDAKRIAAPLLEIAARLDVALLVETDPRIAARLGADGAHVSGVGVELTNALDSLHPERIVGVGGLKLRDEAMEAGEAGADYVMFGEPRRDGWTPPFENTLERVGWWAEIFQTPCVGYAASFDDAEELAEAGADFVAIGDALWAAPALEDAARDLARRVAVASAGRA